MNLIDRAELDILRQEMWDIFSKVAKVPKDQKLIQQYVEAMDRHQEILIMDIDAQDEPEAKINP